MAARTPNKKTRILIVDDHPFFLDGLAQFINQQEDMLVCGEAESIPTTQTEVVASKPDLVLLDLRLAQADSIDLIKQLKAQEPGLHILVISQFDEAIYAERTIRAGASGYVMKQEAPNEVLVAIRTVLQGDLYVSRKIAALVLRRSLGHQLITERVGMDKLSDRELQVFQMLGSGLSTRQVATKLILSLKTIEAHRENIKHKLDLASGKDLVRAATAWVQQNLSPGAKNEVPTVSGSQRKPR